MTRDLLTEAEITAALAGLEGWLIPTKRNVPVRDLYERHGFSVVETTGDGARWRLDLYG